MGTSLLAAVFGSLQRAWSDFSEYILDGRDLDFQMEPILSLPWIEVCRKLEITVKMGGEAEWKENTSADS